ncbi:hypothetical protein CC86DRAFT_362278 [Ophiobolus disseminans]|uniref:RED-like N-terminal domain-containing protein n=1 Tax=Ophiobolus disseminans TaxID=1469910 RepID=A0A6A6ZGQ8_9PLEO|nr:hypothetical protein CC86DRAFT_362278 [Ophiobolus disseminans]
MNNSQFRRLLLSDTLRSDGDKAKTPAAGTPKAVLGARKHSSIPMTPRQVGRGSVQADFARQLAERNAKANPEKKARASAPKGTRLAAGYTDRTKDRVDPEDSEIAKRIKNLEESMKAGDIDRATFESLVQDITGGDYGTTHLVKGLDRKLLERVRRGEDVTAVETENAEVEREEEAEEVSPALEDAFDELADEDVGPIVREKAEKKGERSMAPPPPVAGAKRSRNDILKDLKRQREEAAAAAAAEHEKKFPSLGPGFRKISAQGEASRIEIDEKGREVLIVTGADGKEKRKIRKQKVDEPPAPEIRHDLDDATKPINMHNLPEQKKEESEDEDIFEGVGSSYNPLANLDDEDDDSEDEAAAKQDDIQAEQQLAKESAELDVTAPESREHAPEHPTATTSAKRDYFKSVTRDAAGGKTSDLSSADATVRAALAKVRNLDENSTLLQNLGSSDPDDAGSKEARLKKRAAELAASDRDMEDMDLGFGASRFDDADDMEREGEKIKFSQWKGLGTEEDPEDADDGGRDAKKQRKRGSKKKKGDKNKAEDVLNVMERQKKEKKTLG